MAIPSAEIVDNAKKIAAEKAAEFIKDGMLVGLGTGSTAFHFINALIERRRKGLNIRAIATSERSKEQALAGGIPLLNLDKLTTLDITVDGADEIDSKKRMIKGGGGALLREKIVATMSKEMVVIADEGKQVPFLGKFPLPVEIASFAHQATIHLLNEKGYHGTLRSAKNVPYITDNGNYIYDIIFPEAIENPEEHEIVLQSIPGILSTGFFLHLAGRVVIGHYDGSTTIIQ